MSERGLTFKQRRFAELVASGSTKVEAFRRAYPSDRRGKGTEREGAKRIARMPKVQAEVERLTLLRSPHDATAQAEHIAARLLELTKDPDSVVALRAIAQWSKLAEAGLLKRPEVYDKEKDSLIDELMGLYQKSAIEAQLRPLLQEQPESTPQVIDVESEQLAPMSVAEASPVRSLLPPTEQDSADRPEAPEESIVKTDVYEWQNLPGYFGKSRRVRVRIR
jgi:hypothetical protein